MLDAEPVERARRGIASAGQFLGIDGLAAECGGVKRFASHDVERSLSHEHDLSWTESSDAAEIAGNVFDQILEASAIRALLINPR